MKLSIKKFAKLTSVSVRTLHYYDEIGLLKPDYTDAENGYRFYGENALCRMQEIMFYRELDFPLKSIMEILSSPDYNKTQALSEQKKLLVLKKERLERIINAIESAEKGEAMMDFKAFDNSEAELYKEEVKKRWGNTKEYAESQGKSTKGMAEGMNAILAEFAALMKSGVSATDKKATAMAKKLQDFITETQYTCTKEILSCLCKMYVGDERFKANIDRHGEGNAEYINAAIKAYCKP